MERKSRVNCKHLRLAGAVGLLCGILITGDAGRAQSGATGARSGRDESAVADLAAEVRDKGWIVYSAQSGAGDWDLFVMRPDGSDRRNITGTQDFNEAAGRFSPDGDAALVLSHAERPRRWIITSTALMNWSSPGPMERSR